MSRTVTRKSYPMLKWSVTAALVVIAIGIFVSRMLTGEGNTTKFLYFLGGAVVVAFLGVLFPRREVFDVEVPSDRLADAKREDLQGVLDQLKAAKDRGELTDERYQNARNKVLAQMKAK